MSEPGPLVFLDTETTGLDPDRHSVWEVAWAVDDGPINAGIVVHRLDTADPEALVINRYHDRVQSSYGHGAQALDTESALRAALVDATIVGANPAFDTAFLRARWGVAPWHYRMIDVETYAMPVLSYDRPQGMKRITADLRAAGYEIPEPDHTAAGDVATLRAAYEALRRAPQRYILGMSPDSSQQDLDVAG